MQRAGLAAFGLVGHDHRVDPRPDMIAEAFKRWRNFAEQGIELPSLTPARRFGEILQQPAGHRADQHRINGVVAMVTAVFVVVVG